MLGRDVRAWRGCIRGLRRPKCTVCFKKSHIYIRLAKNGRDDLVDVPDDRREPILKRKRFTPITSVQTAIRRGFEETEVNPGDKESELDEYKGGRAEEDDEDVGDEEMDAGKGLVVESVEKRKKMSEERVKMKNKDEYPP